MGGISSEDTYLSLDNSMDAVGLERPCHAAIADAKAHGEGIGEVVADSLTSTSGALGASHTVPRNQSMHHNP